MSTHDFKVFADGTSGDSMSKGADGKWKKNTTGTSKAPGIPTPKVNAKKIESNAKKIEKLMGMLKNVQTSSDVRKKGVLRIK